MVVAMKPSSWKEFVELIGIAAIVASLVFVGLQLRQEQEIAIVDTHGAMSQSSIDLMLKIGDNMTIWMRGLEGRELSPEDAGVFVALAAAVKEHHQRMYVRWNRLGPVDPDESASRFAYALYIFPGLRKAYESAEQFETSLEAARGFGEGITTWESAVDRYLANLDEEQPPMPQTKEYIFWSP